MQRLFELFMTRTVMAVMVVAMMMMVVVEMMLFPLRLWGMFPIFTHLVCRLPTDTPRSLRRIC
jgi:hypothetical protein